MQVRSRLRATKVALYTVNNLIGLFDSYVVLAYFLGT